MVLAAYMVAGGLAATPYAVGLLRGRRDRYHRLGFVLRRPSPPSRPRSRSPWATRPRARLPASSRSSSRRWSTSRRPPGAPPEWIGGVWYHGHVVTGTGIPLPDVDSLLVGFSPHTR